MRIVRYLTGAIALSGFLAAAGVSAEGPMITGKKDVICATQDILACVDNAACMQGKPSTFDMPTFMFIDVSSKVIRAVDQDGSSVTSAIKTHEITDVSAIMQGYENHRGWTLAIDKMDGSFTLSATGPDVNFMMMGACTQS